MRAQTPLHGTFLDLSEFMANNSNSFPESNVTLQYKVEVMNIINYIMNKETYQGICQIIPCVLNATYKYFINQYEYRCINYFKIIIIELSFISF